MAEPRFENRNKQLYEKSAADQETNQHGGESIIDESFVLDMFPVNAHHCVIVV